MEKPGQPELNGHVDIQVLQSFEDNTAMKRGTKSSLAERNRERQQRFRQRQKTRIEELDSRNNRLSHQVRVLTDEKEAMSRDLAMMKDLIAVREYQIAAVTSRLAQLLPNAADLKEMSTPEGILASISTQLPIAPLAAVAPIVPVPSVPPQAEPIRANMQEDRPSSFKPVAKSCGPMKRELAPKNSDSSGQAATVTEVSISLPSRAASPVALDQLCQVAAEMQDHASADTESQVTQSGGLGNEPNSPSSPISCPMSESFAGSADTVITIDGQKVLVHSALLASHSNYYANKFAKMQHSQPLYPHSNDPIHVDMGSSVKGGQTLEAFLRHCYGTLDVRTVRDEDIMQLVLLAEELQAKLLIQELDGMLSERSEGKPFSWLSDLSNGGDMVDWIRLSDSMGMKKVGDMCESHLARHLKEHQSGKDSQRMHELGQESLMRVIAKLAQL